MKFSHLASLRRDGVAAILTVSARHNAAAAAPLAAPPAVRACPSNGRASTRCPTNGFSGGALVPEDLGGRSGTMPGRSIAKAVAPVRVRRSRLRRPIGRENTTPQLQSHNLQRMANDRANSV